MIVSRAVEYSLIAVGYIALHQKEGKLTAPEISKEYHIPLTFLFKLLNDLKKAGILLSKRGPLGGYGLAREPEKISLLEIFRVIEGSNFTSFNFAEGKSNEPFLIRMQEVSNKADSEVKRILSEATVADMIERKKQKLL